MPVTYGSLTFERLGHASVRITDGDSRVTYIDPWIEVLKEDSMPADFVFVTHDDRDHYDVDAIDAVASDTTKIVVYDAIDTSPLSHPVLPLGAAETRSVGEYEVSAVPAYNRTDGNHVDEDGNPYHAEGEVIGLLLIIEGVLIYFASDTDALDVHESLSVDVFIPPIGGNFTMDRHEAADLARELDPELVLPVHYDTFEEIETDSEEFERELEADNIDVELC